MISETKAQIFTQEVFVVTEMRDGAVYKTKSIGKVCSYRDALPFRPDVRASKSGATITIVPKEVNNQ